MEGNSGKAVGRILSISQNICLYLDKKIREKANKQKLSKRKSGDN